MSVPLVLLIREMCSDGMRCRILAWLYSASLKVRWSSGARPAHRSRAASANGTPLARWRGGSREDCAQPFRQLDERSRNFPGKLSHVDRTTKPEVGRTAALLHAWPYNRWCDVDSRISFSVVWFAAAQELPSPSRCWITLPRPACFFGTSSYERL